VGPSSCASLQREELQRTLLSVFCFLDGHGSRKTITVQVERKTRVLPHFIALYHPKDLVLSLTLALSVSVSQRLNSFTHISKSLWIPLV